MLEGPSNLKTEINQMGGRLTKQRQAILQYLESVTSHPTAETVFLNVKRKLPNISLGTVYRNLEYLAERGYILELNTTDNERHFDGCTKSHWHYICDRCGNIYDLKRMPKSIDRRRVCWGNVQRVECNLYGICKKCAAKKSKN